MSNWLQVLLGFLPVCAILGVLIFKKEKMRLQWTVSLVLVAVIGTGAAILSESNVFRAGKAQTSMENTVSKGESARPNDFLSVAYSFMNKGQVDSAEKVLQDFLNKCDYSDAYLIASARLSVMKGDLLAADGLYKIINSVSERPSLSSVGASEKEFVSAAAGSATDKASYNDASAAVLGIIESINNDVDDNAKKLVDTYIYLDNTEEKWQSLPDTEKSQIKETLLNDITRLEKTPSGSRYLTIDIFTDTKAKVGVMSENYNEAIKTLNTNMSVENIIIAAELARRGAVSVSDLKQLDFYQKLNNDYDIVKQWINDQMSKSSYSEEEQDIINDILDEISDIYDGSDSSDVSSLIEKMILQYTMENNDSENSKLYLELARVEFSDKNAAKASLYLNTALGTAADSKDPKYAGAARELLNIIKDPDNTEARKKIGTYTAIMLERLTATGAEGIMPTEIPGNNVPDGNGGLWGGNNSGSDGNGGLWGGNNSGSGGNGGLWGGNNSVSDGNGGLWGGNNSVPDIDDDFWGGSSDHNDDGMPPQDGTDDGLDDVTFDQFFTDTLNQNTGSVDIISVDHSKFEEVEAIIAVDESFASNAEEFKKNFDLLDCDIILHDYEVEKLVYSEVNLMLVCDNSGSMSGAKIRDLKSALKSFADTSDDMDIAIIPFNSSVISGNIVHFGSSADKIKECIDKMNANGGTNIYSATKYALEMMPETKDALNVVVLMSDGQDYAPSASDVEGLTELCRKRNTSIFSMGLGSDVDSNIMTLYSDLGNGTYMYVSDSNSLLSFYRYIYKLCMNRYRVKYTAPDTTKVSRSLEIESNGSIYVNDIYNYDLYGSDVTEDDLGDEYTVNIDGVVFNGLQNRVFYRSDLEQTTFLLGSGFEKDMSISVEINGGIKYSLKAEYVDSTKIKITVPAEVSCGIYDVYITYNDKRRVFNSGLVMTANDRHVIRFGDYVFTATEISEIDNTTVLSGIVNMNEWFGFTDKLTIKGDVENDYSISLDYKKAYVQYANNGTCKGLAQYFAEHGYTITIPGVNGHVIYNDPTISSSSDEYPTKAYKYSYYANFRIEDFIEIDTPGMSLYPDRLVIDFQAFTMNFPFADKIAKKVSGKEDLFGYELDHSEKIILKNDEIGCQFSLEYGKTGEDYQSSKELPGKLGNMNVYFRKGKFKIEVDTIEGSGSLEVGVDIAFLSDGLSAKIGIKDWKLDELEVGADFEIDTYIANVPVTFSDFKIGISDMSDNIDYSKPVSTIWNVIVGSTWKGSFDCSMAKISAVYPGLEKYLEDAAVAKLDDVTVSFCLRDFYFSVEAKLNLLGIMDVGECKLEFGANIPYTNLMLGMDDEKVGGIVAKLTAGPMIDTKNFDLKFTAGIEVALTTGVIGVTVSGDLEISVSWWVFVKKFTAHGEAFVGSYKNHSGSWQFVVYAAGTTSNGKAMKPICFPHGALNSVSL